MFISIKGFFTRYKQPEFVELELSVPSDVTVDKLRKVELSTYASSHHSVVIAVQITSITLYYMFDVPIARNRQYAGASIDSAAVKRPSGLDTYLSFPGFSCLR